MKTWTKPLVINVSSSQMENAIKAAAYTCINKFVR